MSFPRYEKYKNSGVEWLGEVPEHWELKYIRYLLQPSYDGLKIGPFGSQLTSQMLQESGYKVYGQENVIANDFNRGERFISTEKFQELSVYEIRPGDILITMMGTSGRCEIVPKNIDTGIMDSHLLRMRVTNEIRTQFMRLLIDESIYVAHQVKVLGKGSIMHGLNSSIIKELFLTIPPVEEQDFIFSFLNRETAKIDALIAEQQRLIELLKEKRQAVISHAVTKGLNPNAPMKDSGIEWLGEVPEHWEVMSFKRSLSFLTSGSRGWADHYSDEGALFIRIGNLTRDSIRLDLSDIQRVSVPEGTEGERTKVQPGDVLFSITAYLGSVAVVPEKLESAYVSQHVALARLKKQNLLPDWAAYVVLSFVGKTYLETQAYGGTKIQLSLDDVANLVMTTPEIKEQSTIVAFLNQETAKFDTLTTEAQRAIELLKERRTALISAAVTGKIDVRNQQ